MRVWPNRKTEPGTAQSTESKPQFVKLETASGAARIRIPAAAGQDGEVGETGQLRSGWNGSRLTGLVTSAKRARVE